MSFSSVTLQGNLTRDSETVNFAGGGAVTKFSVAVSRRYKKGDEWKEVPTFVDVEVFRELELSKGDPVVVLGELESQSWEKDGQKRSKLIVRASKIQRFSRLEKSNSQSESEPQGELVGATAGGDDIPF